MGRSEGLEHVGDVGHDEELIRVERIGQHRRGQILIEHRICSAPSLAFPNDGNAPTGSCNHDGAALQRAPQNENVEHLDGLDLWHQPPVPLTALLDRDGLTPLA